MINVPQDSYVTVAEADAYHAIRPSANAWAALTEPEKEQRLVAASDYLDSQYIFNGKKTDENQPREFPRNGATEIPTAIKKVVTVRQCNRIGLHHHQIESIQPLIHRLSRA